MDWLAIVTGLWGLTAGPAGFWLGRKDRQRDAMPNVRALDFASASKGFSGVIEIHARTSEDIILTSINAAGPVSANGEEMLEYDEGGGIAKHEWIFTPTPRPLNWRVAGNHTERFKVRVDSLDHFIIELTISSGARTLVDKVVRLYALPPA